jgi:hypothetical protein
VEGHKDYRVSHVDQQFLNHPHGIWADARLGMFAHPAERIVAIRGVVPIRSQKFILPTEQFGVVLVVGAGQIADWKNTHRPQCYLPPAQGQGIRLLRLAPV